MNKSHWEEKYNDDEIRKKVQNTEAQINPVQQTDTLLYVNILKKQDPYVTGATNRQKPVLQFFTRILQQKTVTSHCRFVALSKNECKKATHPTLVNCSY